MAKKKNNGLGFFTNKNMAIMLLIAILINEVLPRIGLGGLGVVALILTLIVTIVLFMKS
jgi:hypothetical protein